MSSIEQSEVVVLIGWWPSMFNARIRIALAEKGINYEYVEEDLPDNKSPLLLKHNPIYKLVPVMIHKDKHNPIYKLVPVMIHKDKPICESKIIVQYIDETWKEGYSLLPSDPYLKSQAAFWADYIDKHAYDGMRRILFTEGEEMQKRVAEFLEFLRVLERELGEKPYFNGESFGFVDMSLICYYSHIIAYETLGNFSVDKECPKLVAWATQCMKRESVSKALPDPNKLYELLNAFRKKAKE